MHVLRWLRIFVPLLLVAALVAGTVLVLTSRSELRRSRRQVATAWSPLRGALDSRYQALHAANDAVSSVPGPLHQIVTEVAAAYTHWRDLERHDGSVTSEVDAANDLEALGRRLVTAARAAPRLQGKQAALSLVDAFAALGAPEAAGPFNAAVGRFEKLRARPSKRLAARILGYGAISRYDDSDSG